MNEQSNQQIKQVVKVIFAWEDEKEEKWLEDMAAQGWTLISVAPFVYTFKRDTPQKVVYRLDYMLTTQKDYKEYLALFRDAGWELVATMANWHYFRIEPQNNEVPEIYNSGRAKAQKYRRLLFGFVPFMPIFVIMISRFPQIPPEGTTSVVEWIHFAITLLMGGVLVLWSVFFIKIILKIRGLEQNNVE